MNIIQFQYNTVPVIQQTFYGCVASCIITIAKILYPHCSGDDLINKHNQLISELNLHHQCTLFGPACKAARQVIDGFPCEALENHPLESVINNFGRRFIILGVDIHELILQFSGHHAVILDKSTLDDVGKSAIATEAQRIASSRLRRIGMLRLGVSVPLYQKPGIQIETTFNHLKKAYENASYGALLVGE